MEKRSAMNNKGFSLIELIVVIAIMTIVTGTVTIGISVMFSKDAERCATRLNDAIYTTRMENMSKIGDFVLTVTTDDGTSDGKCIAIIDKAGVSQTIYLDGDSGKRTTINPIFTNESGVETSLTLPVNIKFHKAKGNVVSITAGGTEYTDPVGILTFNISALRGNKESKVQLITTTGKHTVGEFQ